METKVGNAGLCKNVFKNGTDKIIKEELTQKWIETINELERNRYRAYNMDSDKTSK